MIKTCNFAKNNNFSVISHNCVVASDPIKMWQRVSREKWLEITTWNTKAKTRNHNLKNKRLFQNFKNRIFQTLKKVLEIVLKHLILRRNTQKSFREPRLLTRQLCTLFEKFGIFWRNCSVHCKYGAKHSVESLFLAPFNACVGNFVDSISFLPKS